MKILQVVSFLSPVRGGGVVSSVYQLSRALIDQGHEVVIYTSDFELDQEYIDSLVGVRVILFRSYLSLNNRPLIMKGLIKTVKEDLNGFDIIHMHECRGYMNLILYYFACQNGIPYIVDAHGAQRKPRGLLKRLANTAYGKRILQNANRVIAETEIGANEYKSAGVDPSRISMIYPPFPLKEFGQIPPPGIFREKHKIYNEHLILFMGRISHIKGLDFLIDSFRDLCRQRNDIILVIAGSDDGYQSILERRIRELDLVDKTIFVGFIKGTDKKSALVDASVIVQPSLYEQGLPKPCIEAALCGTPFIVTRGTGAGSLANYMNAGFLVDYNDTSELSKTIQFVLGNPTEAVREANKVKRYVISHLSMEKGVCLYENIYQSCLKDLKEQMREVTK